VKIVGNGCVSGFPHNDKESDVCDNDGQEDEAYCSYDIGSDACAYCVNLVM